MHSSDSVVPVSDSRPTSGWYSNRCLLLASLTGSERRGTSSTAPGLVPWPRRPGRCRLLLTCLTGSERRGTSSTLHDLVPLPRHPGGRRPMSRARAPFTKDFERSKCSWWRRQQSGIFFDDPLCDRTSAQCAQCFHGRKPSQCTFSFHSMDTVHCVYLVYFYLLLRVSTLHICFLLFFSVLLLNQKIH